MKYHGAQPCQGDLPHERFSELEQVMKTSLELWFSLKLESVDDVWARLGALQIYLEHGLTATLLTIIRAVKDCERLEDRSYASEWKKEEAIREGLRLTKEALVELQGDLSSDSADRNLLVDLGRDKLIAGPLAKRLKLLWRSDRKQS